MTSSNPFTRAAQAAEDARIHNAPPFVAEPDEPAEFVPMFDDKGRTPDEVAELRAAAEAQAAAEPTWNTAELQRDFEVLGFSAPYVVVVRKSDGKRGALEFTHSPRLYFDFQEG